MLNGGVYFHYVEGNRTRDEQYWQHHFTDRSIESWEGFTFEEVCLRHPLIIKIKGDLFGNLMVYSYICRRIFIFYYLNRYGNNKEEKNS
jgi:hypothetical protein